MPSFGLYSIRDLQTGFMDPVKMASDEIAVHEFKAYVESLILGKDEVLEKFHINPADLQIFKVGSMDISTGIITSTLPTCLYSGSSISVRKEELVNEKSEC